MIAGYVVLDGFDLGAGAIHLFVARTDKERRSVLASIGPVWNGNEVWLLAAGGTLFFAFPSLYASGFSGFYLALMIVLWLLILRGIAIELRSHVNNDLWQSFWDVVFAGASALLAIFYGAALGNVVRGVPLRSDGYFFLPLWTNLRPGSDAGIIDWYSVLVGVTALVALMVHGSLWVALKSEGDVQRRANQIARRAWIVLVGAVLAVSAASFWIQPHLRATFAERPWGIVFPLLAAAGLFSVRIFNVRRAELAAFLASCGFLLGILCSAVFGLYPYVLPSNVNPAESLTVDNASAAMYGLRIGIYWFVPALMLVAGYSAFVYRHFRGKVQAEEVH
jgi:cytochrome d ubiquinol oxidase subunit II